MKRLLKYKNVLFGLLTFAALFFLIAQPGVWAYVDAGYQFSILYNFSGWTQRIFDVTGYGYNGDITQITAGRYIINIIEILFKTILGAKRGNIFLYLSFFGLNYFLTKKILQIWINKNYAFIGALFYAFNPLSIYMLNEIGFLYAYSAVPFIVLGMYYYFQKTQHIFLGAFLTCLGTFFLSSYTRLTLIYMLFFVILAALYYKDIRLLILKQKGKSLMLFLLVLFTNISFIFSVFYPYISGNNEYFAGVSHYAKVHEDNGNNLYRWKKGTSLAKLLVPTEPLSNFGVSLGNNNIFIYFSFFYFAFIVFFLFSRQPYLSRNEHTLTSLSLISIVVGSVSQILPYYVNEKVFTYVSYTLLPFLANYSGFAHWFLLVGISIAIPLCLKYTKKWGGRIILFGTLIYCIASVSILMFYSDNHKLQTINIENNQPLKESFHRYPNDQIKQGGLIYPTYGLLFNRSPYPVSIKHLPGFRIGVEKDERTVTSKQTQFSDYISKVDHLNSPYLSNLGLLSIETFLIAKDISTNPDKIHFDRYSDKDNVAIAQDASNTLSKNRSVNFVQENVLYKEYDIIDSDLFSFDVYLPKSIVMLDSYSDLLNTGFSLTDRPLFIDQYAYGKPNYIDSKYVISYNTGQSISIKTRKKNIFSYYIALHGTESGQDISLQLNKTFGTSWRIKEIDKNTFDSISCNSKYYPISDNTFCYSDKKFPPLQEFFDVFFSKTYSNVAHFEGNILGNSWILKNIQKVDKNGTIYILISHDKQYLFIITQVLAITIFVLLLLGVFTSLKDYRTDEDKNK